MIIDNINTVEEFQDYIEDIDQYQSEFDSKETYNEWMDHLEEAIIRINANKDDMSTNNYKFTKPTKLYRSVSCNDQYGQSWTTTLEDALYLGDNKIYSITIDPEDQYICWWNSFDGDLFEVVVANVKKKYKPVLVAKNGKILETK